ncbi:hypothetical protein [Methylibium sp.]|uniref:hypothetical protein n=1 Tax=Methylibium sp. TaxID=2067992 RepID=UPI00185B1A77|nr:hypothetical protein [Methylibium sp.]MBA3590619.1 hypothetical protein [Methylibium sp.]
MKVRLTCSPGTVVDSIQALEDKRDAVAFVIHSAKAPDGFIGFAGRSKPALFARAEDVLASEHLVRETATVSIEE